MTVVPGSIVTPKQGNTLLAPNTFAGPDQPQPPIFGCVQAVAGGPPATTGDVLWNDGKLIAGILLACLDELVDADPTEVDRISGRLVRHQPDTGSEITDIPEYDAMVVILYRKQDAAAVPPVTPGPNLALVKTLTNGLFYEFPTSELIVVEGR